MLTDLYHNSFFYNDYFETLYCLYRPSKIHRKVSDDPYEQFSNVTSLNLPTWLQIAY